MLEDASGEAQEAVQHKAQASLDRFFAKRRRVLGAMALASFAQGFAFGSSVVADSLNRVFSPQVFDPESGDLTYNLPGIYSVAVLAGVTFLFGGEIILPLIKRFPQHKKAINISLFWLQPLGLVLTGLSVRYISPALLYVGLTLLVGLSLAAMEVLTRLEVLQWYGVDGTNHIGVGACGLVLGGSTIFYTLFTAWVVNYGGHGFNMNLEICFYALAGLSICSVSWLTYETTIGSFDAAPTPAEFKEWLAAASTSTSADRDQSENAQTGSAQSSDASPAGAQVRPAGTSALIPVKLENRWEALRYPVVWILAVYIFLEAFNGFATKVLLSSMFVLIFQLDQMLAAYLSALSLIFFFIGRGVVPFYFVGKNSKIGVAPEILTCASLLISGLMYLIVPAILGDKPPDSAGGFSWSLFGFVVVKSMISLSFASVGSLTGPTMASLGGTANLIHFIKWMWISAFFELSYGRHLSIKK